MQQFDLFGALRPEDLTLGGLDRLAFLLEGPPHRLLLAAQTGALLEPTDAQQVSPRVLQVAHQIGADLVREGGRSLRDTARSAMQKEVRRGEGAHAVRWARLVGLIAGPAEVRLVARRIVLEETRALGLVRSWRGARGLSGEHMIGALAAAPKKWLLPTRVAAACESERLLAYPQALQGGPLTPAEVARVVMAREPTLADGYRLLWRVQLAREPAVVAHLREVLLRRVASRGEAGWGALAQGSEPHLAETLLEYLCGVLDPTSAEGAGADGEGPATPAGARPLEEVVLTVPPLRSYLHDVQTRPGRQRLVRHLAHLAPEKPMPPGLDLRWSGMARGSAWRAAAVAQAGAEGLTRPWEEIAIPGGLWQAAVLVDGFSSASLYREAGLEPPLPRVDWRGSEPSR